MKFMDGTLRLRTLMPSIRNIIFDLGGVIINIDYHRTRQAFEELGVLSFGEVYSQAAQSGLFDQYEKGLISSATFRAKLQEYAPKLGLNDNAIDGAWNAMLLDFPVHRLEVLAGLKSKFRTFLLSNTNEVHLAHFQQILETTIGKSSLTEYFEQTYYSHEVNLRKPDAEIFRFVLDRNGLTAGETLFIDDTIRHVEAARALGIHGLHVGEDISIEELYSVLAEYC